MNARVRTVLEDLEELRPKIRRAAVRMAGADRVLADDLVQEGELAAWTAGQAWDPLEDVPRAAWMLVNGRWSMRSAVRLEVRRERDQAAAEAADRVTVGDGPAVQLLHDLDQAPGRHRVVAFALLEAGGDPIRAAAALGLSVRELRRRRAQLRVWGEVAGLLAVDR